MARVDGSSTSPFLVEGGGRVNVLMESTLDL